MINYNKKNREHCHNVPEKQCQKVPKQQCRAVPDKECHLVPRQKCIRSESSESQIQIVSLSELCRFVCSSPLVALLPILIAKVLW